MPISIYELPLIDTTLIKDSDIMYVVSKLDGNQTTMVDYSIRIGDIVNYVNGTEVYTALVGNDYFTVTDSKTDKRKIITQTSIEKRLFGETEFKTTDIGGNLSDSLKFRVTSESDVRGFVTLESIRGIVNSDGSILDALPTDVSKFMIKVSNDGTNGLIGVKNIFDRFIGKDSFTTVANGDSFRVVKENGESGSITLGRLVDVINPNTSLTSETQVNADLKIHATVPGQNVTRGYATLGTLTAFVLKELKLPTFELSDNFSQDVTIGWKDKDKYGYMSTSALKALVNPTGAITKLEDTTVFKVDGGTVGFGAIKTEVLKSVNNIYGISDTMVDDLNDSDGFLFKSAGASTGLGNVSFLTLKQKILNDDVSFGAIDPTTKIYTSGGYITYETLKNKLHQDIFG